MKSYTDLEQSKKLAEILPLESADMFLAMNGTLPVMSKYIDDGLVTADETAIPCWSLAALLDFMPTRFTPILTRGSYYPEESENWFCYLDNNADFNSIFNSEHLLDAAFEMIIQLKEKGLI